MGGGQETQHGDVEACTMVEGVYEIDSKVLLPPPTWYSRMTRHMRLTSHVHPGTSERYGRVNREY
jgi:hypothetical protein